MTRTPHAGEGDEDKDEHDDENVDKEYYNRNHGDDELLN